MRGGRRSRVWLILTGLAGCVRHGALPPREPAPEHQPTATPSHGDERAAQLDREVDVHTRRLEHSDPQERLRARLDLADACWRRAEQEHERLWELDEQRVGASPERLAELDRLAVDRRAQQATWYERAITAYQDVLASPEPAAQPLRTEARYGLAAVLRVHRRDRAEARQLLEALVRDDPENALAGSALVQLGDDAFEEQRFDDARALYEQVLRTPAAREHGYASYKLGWIALTLDDAQTALEHWARVVQRTRGDSTQRSLGDSAAKDCVLAFVRVGRPEQAVAFFRQLHPGLAPALLQRLMEQYRNEGRPDAALVVAAGLARP